MIGSIIRSGNYSLLMMVLVNKPVIQMVMIGMLLVMLVVCVCVCLVGKQPSVTVVQATVEASLAVVNSLL